jgi:HD-GYP domain-containing protein (c-di-GMP phosphodiesterase class II)
MDPILEQLHEEQQQRVSDAPSFREWATEAVATVLLVLVCVALWALTPRSANADVFTVIAMVALYACAWQVNFDVGIGATTPLQLVFIPMWFVVEPALLPVIVGAGQLLGNVVQSIRANEQHHWQRALIGIPDAWYAVGPAVVLAAFGAHTADLSDWPIYVLALAAQFALDSTTNLRSWAATGDRPRGQARIMVWITMVDLALAPLGLMAAVLMQDSVIVVLAVVPLVGLLHEFAKERDDRITKALELSHAYRGTAQLMGDVLEADDEYTGGEHTQGVVELSVAVGQTLGLDAQSMRDLEFGALLHDIGKLRVPNEIINKPGKLDAEEWAIIKQHPGWGQEMLDRVGGALSQASPIVRAHHERFDGAGYPDGLAGDEIPIEARIITVCDSFSAMTTNRSYRRGMSHADAIDELRRCSGSQFDPQVVEALTAMLHASEEPNRLKAVPNAELSATPALRTADAARNGAGAVAA